MTSSIFLSYACQDQRWRDELVAHLSDLRGQGSITDWQERAIGTGVEGTQEIDPSLEAAQLILLLVTPQFVNSAYCFGAEMKCALQRHQACQARVIPIMLHPVDMEDTPFARLPTFPSTGTPVSAWPSSREALLDIASSIKAAANAPPLDCSPMLSAPLRPAPVHLDPMALWNVPHRRNPFFTGREPILTYLHDMPIPNKAIASTPPQALSGPPGIGKTQLALEYAYRYRDHYEAVLWVNAASRELLTANFAQLAALLGLPEKDQPNQRLALNAVKGWLHTSTGWLLILDNLPDLPMVRDLLPPGGRGHTLLVTRQPVPRPFGLNIDVPTMPLEDQACLLLRRAGIIASNAPPGAASRSERQKAQEIAEALHGFPLALELAGAYISEAQCGLTSYLNLYKGTHVKIRKWQREPLPDDIESVTTALLISCEKIERSNSAAVELLRLCAFLHPDAIPEELFTDGSAELGPILQPVASDWFELQKTLRVLRRHALVQRNLPDATLTIHRLVQGALTERMSQEIQQQWAERTVRTLAQAFPPSPSTTPHHWHRYLPHLLTCGTLIEHWSIEAAEAAGLLERAGDAARTAVQYEQAEWFLRRAFAIREHLLGPDHPHVAPWLKAMAGFYDEQGKSAEAEVLYQRLLTLQERVLGPEHPEVATCLNDLAVSYRTQGKYALAEPLFQRALEMQKKALGFDHLEVATILQNLALLSRLQGKYTQAEPLVQRALTIREQALGTDHPMVAQSCNVLAGIYRAQGRDLEAEQCYQRALAIYEQGSEHPDLATTLNNLALLSHQTSRYAQAEAFYQRALAIYERRVGQDHPDVARCLGNLALLYHDQGVYEQAEPLYQRALHLCERALGPAHPSVAVCLNNLATLYTAQGKYAQAKPLFRRALAIGEQTLGPHHPDLAQFLENYALVLQKSREWLKASQVEARAHAIRDHISHEYSPR